MLIHCESSCVPVLYSVGSKLVHSIHETDFVSVFVFERVRYQHSYTINRELF